MLSKFLQPGLFCLLLLRLSCVTAETAALPAWPDLDARLRVALQLAREANKRDLVKQVEEAADAAKKSFQSNDPARADSLVRELEPKLGIDPGGWSMSGQPIFHPTSGMLDKLKSLAPGFRAALEREDESGVRKAIAEWRSILGDQAGLPDARRKGVRVPIKQFTESQAVEYFLKAIETDRPSLKQISDGRPLKGQMLRLYAGIVSAVCEIRPLVIKHQPERLPELDQMVTGACGIMTRAQQADGHFPFPDLRGINIRFGDLIDRDVAAGKAKVVDGWLVTVDADGGSQFDTGLCGVALLSAGKVLRNTEWIQAGIRAADWSLGQKCCPNFNYNAFSVSLLARAFRATSQSKYLDGALHKFRIGVAPGQVTNGRWIDAHNARTVYHHILFRGLNDLIEAMPQSRVSELAEVDAVAGKAAKAVLDEIDAVGVTVDMLVELLRYEAAHSGADPRLPAAIRLSASVILEKSAKGDRAKFVSAPEELAALPRAAGR